MDPKSGDHAQLFAPPASGSSGALRLPSQHELSRAPRIDEHLVTPESREELVRGRRFEASPARSPHGDRHFKLDYVLGAHLRDGYIGSTDLLTRAGPGSDFATDTCIRRQGIDPTTDERYLEELAFEIVNEQSLRDITEKAQDLTTCGVRRVLAIFVKKGEVREWSTESGEWIVLDREATFSDPTLARPLRVKDLVDAAEADIAVARALRDKGNPVFEEVREQGRKESLLATIGTTCEAFEIAIDEETRARLEGLDAEELERVQRRLLVERQLGQ